MKSHRPAIAATVLVLAIFGVGITASGSAGAEPPVAGKISTTTKVPNSIAVCRSGSNCRPVKNAALPSSTTTIPPKITPICRNGSKCRPVKNAALTSSTTTIPPKIGKPKKSK